MVFIIGQLTGLFIYGRNLRLIVLEQRRHGAAASPSARPGT
jgi:lipid-A-disaccharide synthase-like uncharacterized protein